MFSIKILKICIFFCYRRHHLDTHSRFIIIHVIQVNRSNSRHNGITTWMKFMLIEGGSVARVTLDTVPPTPEKFR